MSWIPSRLPCQVTISILVLSFPFLLNGQTQLSGIRCDLKPNQPVNEFKMPVQPTAGRNWLVTNDFGNRVTSRDIPGLPAGTWQHTGVDYLLGGSSFQSEKQPVYSAANGVVVFSTKSEPNPLKSRGGLLVIKHVAPPGMKFHGAPYSGSGGSYEAFETQEIYTYYLHLAEEEILKKSGDQVRIGEQIAKTYAADEVGNGKKYSYVPHLHLEVWSSCTGFELNGYERDGTLKNSLHKPVVDPVSFLSNVKMVGKPGQTATRTAPDTSRNTGDCALCGEWKYFDDASQSMNFLRISRAGENRYKLVTGASGVNNQILWLDYLDIRNSDGIYLRGTGSSLSGQFVSSNFRATRSQYFTYRISCEIRSDGTMRYRVSHDAYSEDYVASRLSGTPKSSGTNALSNASTTYPRGMTEMSSVKMSEITKGKYSLNPEKASNVMSLVRAGGLLSFPIPSNWRYFSGSDSALLAPEGAYGKKGITHGLAIGFHQKNESLEASSQALIKKFLKASKHFRQVQGLLKAELDRQPALKTQLSGVSPMDGELEHAFIYTTKLPTGWTLYLAFITSEKKLSEYEQVFRAIRDGFAFGADGKNLKNSSVPSRNEGSLTGVIVDIQKGMYKWEAIVIQVEEKKYFVYTFSTVAPTPKIVGTVDKIGARVLVTFDEIKGSDYYDGDIFPKTIEQIPEKGQPRGALVDHATDEIKNQLVEQMVEDGDVSRSCVRQEGGGLEFLNLSLLYLNSDKQPEYLVTGKGCGCVGSVRCASSIYHVTTNGFEKIYRSESNEDIEVLNSRTNGYRDLRVTLISGSQTYSATVKFNGSRYQIDQITPPKSVNVAGAQRDLSFAEFIDPFLNANYPSWKVTSQAQGCYKDFQNSFLKGDFNGDGREDYVLKFEQKNRGFILAFVRSGSTFVAHTLYSDSAEGVTFEGMKLGRKGDRYVVGGDYPNFIYGRLPNDAPFIGPCASDAGGFYIFRDGRFEQ